ncbi:MAG: heme exporter protein CcmD [Pyrinomonadaceae bacterium]|nr:heme exporter protein CcmD [Pyrinomonadaceae bacterium]
MNWSEFFHMGGYAFYVWGSYLLTFVVIVVEILTVVRCQKRLAAHRGADSKSTKVRSNEETS